MYRIIISVLCAFFFNALSAQGLSLNDYGWREAKTGEQRARVLYNAQTEAVNRGLRVDYSGINRVELEITKEFKSIPLTGHEDFNGIEFIVSNDAKDVPLFSLIKRGKPIEVDKRQLEKARFSTIPELQRGEHLLVIKDKSLWVDNRVGYNYGHTRKDILLIRDGESLNRVISSYNNTQSSPSCTIISVSEDSLNVGNFTLYRASGSKCKTFCLSVQGVAHLLVDRITIVTPDNNLSGDSAIRIIDCANITLKDITISNTYSQPDKYGYGISINNAWNTRLQNVSGTASWGILGNNNMSDTHLSNCTLNRFDIHCYGRNVYLADCTFNGGDHGWYCGGSSIYGVIQYDRCVFVNCTPIAFGDSYKTAVGSDVVFNDCVFNVTKKKYYIFGTKVLNDNINARQGLSQKCLPNIEINRMIINVPKGVRKVVLYYVGNPTYSSEVGYLRNVIINGLVICCHDSNQNVDFKLISAPIRTSRKLKIRIADLTAPSAMVNPTISSNQRNKVLITRSSFRLVNDLRGVKLRIVDSTISQ